MIEVDRIHHADAFDLFSLIDDESIDLIVCDGPYGVTTNKWDRIGNVRRGSRSVNRARGGRRRRDERGRLPS